MPRKTGKNFKDVIREQENKGKTRKAIMKVLTGLDTSLMYAGIFLLSFVSLDVLLFYLLVPSVYVWAGLLIGTAAVSSILASRLTKRLKNMQWKYAS